MYICGLELEEETSAALVSFLEEQHHLQIFFAPGPRITTIRKDFLNRIFALSPILHLNEQEACSFTGTEKLQDALFQLHERTGNDVIVTQGAEGASFIHQGKIHFVPSNKTRVVDTIGAGDAHIGTIIAGLHLGMELSQAIEIANAVSAAVVSVAGASLSQEAFHQATKNYFHSNELHP
jgi:sugar/nucleoside kinase (ribokinase family)